MKTRSGKQKRQKSRRTFLQSMGLSITGFSFLPPFLIDRHRESSTLLKKSPVRHRSGPSVQPDKVLPDGVSAVWDINLAFHETTPTRERICINGLWQWQPGTPQSSEVPAGNWGYYKVPGQWYGRRAGWVRNSQTVFRHPAWKDQTLEDLLTAWYQREISIPGEWTKRKVILRVEYLNSSAAVYINGAKAGDILFPGGELDLTSVCLPGRKYMLTMKVTALPLKDVIAIFNDSNAPQQGKANVVQKGLCGDVYILGIPPGASIRDIKIYTSFRKAEITFNTALMNPDPGTSYFLRFVIRDGNDKVAEFQSRKFNRDDLSEGRFSVTESWKPGKLWDVHTPQNMYEAEVSLLQENKRVLDTALPERFGFREFWIEGRDFFLNGTRIFLSLCPYDNANIGSSWAGYDMARESMLRLMSFGINFVHTHNFGCEPGTHVSFSEILRAADDVGMLISLSQPHFGQYDWTAPDADQANGYAHHAEWYTNVAHNHPSVVCYPTSHNSTGYTEDMNPDLTDGIADPRSPRALESAKRALRAEAIIRKFDPVRIVYHHSSGNLGVAHTSNFYPNWLAIQEMEDWFEHWSTHGVKPMMMVEFGTPWTLDWGTYKGWYKGRRSFGTEPVPWEFCLPEWNSQFLGEAAYRISEYDKENIRWEAARFRAGDVWLAKSIPNIYVGWNLGERDPVWEMHISNEWRAFRAWNVSANCAYNDRPYWHLRKDAYMGRKEFRVDWENLQRPGFSADFIEDRHGRLDLDPQNDFSDWLRTPASDAIIRNNMPLLAYIGGKPETFTSKDHNFLPGSSFVKQLIIINNSRMDVTCRCSWSLNLPSSINGSETVTIPTGRQERIPMKFDLPASLLPGKYTITSNVKFSNGEVQVDAFDIHVIPLPGEVKYTGRTALYDTKGETKRLLDETGIPYQLVEAGADLSGYEILIIGKGSLATEGRGLNLAGVRDGLKVLVFEQSSEVLEKRFGFRVHEQGLRIVHNRIADHPVMNGLGPDNLHDWQGSATILPPRLKVDMNDRVFAGAPTVKWCDITVTRIWRCGNRGNVASVLIEKPACGNFLPVIDGGYSLQYSPLMEYREGKGMIMFCQLDVTGRTENDPAAVQLSRNLLSYLSGWKPGTMRKAVYAGDPEGLGHLKRAGVQVEAFADKKITDEQVLIVSTGASGIFGSKLKSVRKWISAGGNVLAIGLDQQEAGALFPFSVNMKKEEHIAAYFEKTATGSLFAGINPADVHNRDPKEIPLVKSGAEITANGVLAKAAQARVVFCQLVPWLFDYSKEKHNVKQSFRRSSFLLSRLLGNLGVESAVPLVGRFNSPPDTSKAEKRWLEGLYLDQPEEYDDPYRFFRW